jgi:hypothetical protein
MPDVTDKLHTKFTLLDRVTRVEAISGQTFELHEYL